MKATDELSADLKQRLRKVVPVTLELIDEANEFLAEREEAIIEVETGLIPCRPGSYVARVLDGTIFDA